MVDQEMDTSQHENEEIEVPQICSICHNEPPINPVSLECKHIFCYLCAKSAAELSGNCPLCRKEIGPEFNFQEHNIVGVIRPPCSANGFYWYYEGYQGWWLFDAETNKIIESSYQSGAHRIERFIAGYIYVIDLDHFEQRRKDGSGRVRKIKRDTLEIDNIIGLAGIKGPDFDDVLSIMRDVDRTGI